MFYRAKGALTYIYQLHRSSQPYQCILGKELTRQQCTEAPKYISVSLKKEIKALPPGLRVSPDSNSPLLCLLKLMVYGLSAVCMWCVCLCLPNVWLSVTVSESLIESFHFVFIKQPRRHHRGRYAGCSQKSLTEFDREWNLLSPWPRSTQESKCNKANRLSNLYPHCLQHLWEIFAL